MNRLVLSLATVALLWASLSSCHTIENAAARDPRRCELDPNCARKPGNYNDCATACVDSYDCMQRCAQITDQYK